MYARPSKEPIFYETTVMLKGIYIYIYITIYILHIMCTFICIISSPTTHQITTCEFSEKKGHLAGRQLLMKFLDGLIENMWVFQCSIDFCLGCFDTYDCIYYTLYFNCQHSFQHSSIGTYCNFISIFILLLLGFQCFFSMASEYLKETSPLAAVGQPSSIFFE